MGTRLASSTLALLLVAGVAGGGVARAQPETGGAAPRPGPAAPAPSAPPEASTAFESVGADSSVAAASEPEIAPSPRVAGVELHLPPGSDPSGLAELVAIQRGGPLSRREVQRSIERLYATGRFSNVVARLQEVGAGGVVVTLAVENRTYVDRFEFEGNRALTSEALRRTSGLTERRTEYYPEFMARIGQRVRAAYERVGYAGAELEFELTRNERDESVLTIQIDEGAPTRVVAVNLAGDPQLPIASLLETLGLRPGSVLDLDRLDRGVSALRARYRAERYYRARIGAPEISRDERGAVVLLPVNAGPSVEFRFRGNRLFDDAELLQSLGYDGEEPLDATLLPKLEERLASFYRLMGFSDARIWARDVRHDDQRRSHVLFTIEEDRPLEVVEVRFEGNAHFSDAFLRERIAEALREAAPVRPEERNREAAEVVIGTSGGPREVRHLVDPLTVYAEPVYQLALERIVKLYRADGLLGAVAEMPIVERDERARTLRLTIRLREGVQTLISEVSFPGAPDPRRFTGPVAVRVGKPLNSLDVELSRETIQRTLGHEGYLFARVEDEVEFSADRREARVAFKVVPGPKVRVGRILVQGLDRTHEQVVRSALSLEENGILDSAAIAQSQRNLARLGIFRSASIRIAAPEVAEPVKDIYVAAEERGTQVLSLGGGYSLLDGPRAFAEYSKINLFGRALQLQARAKVNYFNASGPVLADAGAAQDGLKAVGRRLNLGLQYPRLLGLLPTEVGLRTDLIHERLNRPAYFFERSAAILGTDVVMPHGISFSLQYEIEIDDIELTRGAQAHLSKTDIGRMRGVKYGQGRVDFHSLRPSLTLDFRDDPANPHRGVFLSASTEFVHTMGASNLDPEKYSYFMKAAAEASVYVPLWSRTVLALSLKGGRMIMLDDRSTTIVTKHFFVGGAGTMRGFMDESMFAEDSREVVHHEVVECGKTISGIGCSEAAKTLDGGEQLVSDGGRLFTVARAELRFPLVGQLEGAVFVDAGNLWLDPSNYRPLALRYASGLGLRLVTPIGPAAFDMGINLSPDLLLNESRFVPHFSIGVF